MDLNFSEIRKLCTAMECKVDLFKFLSDSEVNQFHDYAGDNSSACLVFDDSREVTLPLVAAQQRYYDDLNLYIKLLQELAKFRPLPF